MNANVNLGLFWTIAIAFISLLGFLAWFGWKRTKTDEDFMLAGRRVPPWLMAISYGSALISTSSIVGFGGTAGKVGLGMFWIVTINIGIGIMLAYIVLGPKIRALGARLGAQTMPELLGLRFKSRTIQGIAGAVNFIFMPMYGAAVLIGVSRLMETIIGINFYVAISIYAVLILVYVIGGGLKGMIFADVVLGLLKFSGMAVLFLVLFSKAGGFGAYNALANLPVPAELAKEGVKSFVQMPDTFSPVWWNLVTTLLCGVSLGLLAQPQLGVRFLTLRSTKDIKMAVGFGAFFVIIANGGGILSGALANVVSFKTTGIIAYEAVGRNIDSIIPYAIRSNLPEWVAFIMLFVLFSAGLSTSTAQIHTMSTSLGYDILIRNFKANPSVTLVRICAVVAVIVVSIVACILPKSIVAIATAIFFGIAAAVFLPSILGAVFWRRCTRAAVLWSMSVGISVVLFSYLFMHERESAQLGLCNLLTGKPSLFTGSWLAMIDTSLIAVPLSFITLVVVTLLTRKTDEENI